MHTGTPIRVLIVDDEQIARDLLRAQLNELGHVVCGEATNAEEALRLAEEVHPDIALVDIRMPGQTGVEVSREVSERGNCPVVLLTGVVSVDYINEAAEFGVFGYLTKPVRLGDLGPMVSLSLARFKELDSVKKRLETRTVLQRAKGILMDTYGMTEDEAHKKIHFAARSSNTPVIKIATEVIETKKMPA